MRSLSIAVLFLLVGLDKLCYAVLADTNNTVVSDNQRSYLHRSNSYDEKEKAATENIASDSSKDITSDTISGKVILKNALKKAIGGGIPGAIAGAAQVLCLMWLRTVINYQYRYGSTFLQALSHLYDNGGIPRLYSGLGFALVQAPLSRFVSTAANDGVHNLLQNLEWTKNWGPGREVIVAAVIVGLFRMLLMPIDTSKTVMQIEGEKGFAKLMSQVKKVCVYYSCISSALVTLPVITSHVYDLSSSQGKIHLLYAGSFANALSSFISHYPWFYTYNKLTSYEALHIYLPWKLGRHALIGFLSSIVSDTVANFMRVIKTTKQVLSATNVGITYAETISVILAADGVKGLFGRGLRTRIMGNALQSILFTVIWRGLAQRWQNQSMVEEQQKPEVENETDTDVDS